MNKPYKAIYKQVKILGSRELIVNALTLQMGALRKTTHVVPAAFFSERSDDEILEEELRRSYETLA